MKEFTSSAGEAVAISLWEDNAKSARTKIRSLGVRGGGTRVGLPLCMGGLSLHQGETLHFATGKGEEATASAKKT